MPVTKLFQNRNKLTIDTKKIKVFVGKKEVHLPRHEFNLLKTLAFANGTVLSREDLLNRVWNYPLGLCLDTRVIDQYVTRIRRAMKPFNPIRTVIHVGYAVDESKII